MEDKIRLSLGTAIELGLVSSRQIVPPTTAYLLWDPGCVGKCTFCHRSAGNSTSEKLSRVTWPEFPMKEILRSLENKDHPFRRVCLQTGWNHAYHEDLKKMVRMFLDLKLVLSVTLHPAECTFAGELLEMGIDHVGIGLDAASEKTYRDCKKREWVDDWPPLVNLIAKYGPRIEVHMIFGLGDDEETFIRTMNEISSMGGAVALFAFTPVNGGFPPELSSYRRMQIFRYLQQRSHISFAGCLFRDGRLISYGIPMSTLSDLLADGNAFRTSGCGDCNRPFYNERPGKEFFNYPRALHSEEISKAIRQADIL